MKNTLFSLLLLGLVATGRAQNADIYHDGWIDFNKNGTCDIYEDPRFPIEQRIDDLLNRMTIDEKCMQCVTLYGYNRGTGLLQQLPAPEWSREVWKDGIANIDEHLNGVVPTDYSYPYSRHAEALNRVQRWFVEQTRLGIPVDFSTEGIHGLNHDRATSLPAPIAIGSTWDRDLVHQAGTIVGREARALGYTNVYAPILDLARDPRWGRVLECYGEDPFLVSELGVAMTSGIQSQGVGSTLKHFAVYSVPKGGRDGFTRTDPHVAPRELHQLHLYPWRKVIGRCHPKGVMSSYNDWDGVPVTASRYFLTELLRERYGFRGYVVSDSEAVEYVYNKHRVAPTYKDAVRQVAEAGLNVRTNFTPPSVYSEPLKELVREGRLSMAVLDRNVRDVLRVKFELGLFDHPYVEKPELADSQVAGPGTTEFMDRMARKSLVLLKNEGGLLPLDLNRLGRILITGPLAVDTTAFVSRYGPQNLSVGTVREWLTEYVGDRAEVLYEKGCEVVNPGWPESEVIPVPMSASERKMIDRAVAAARRCDVVIAVMGEDEARCGENKSRTSLELPGRQRELLQALHRTGKPVVLVLINGQPLTINWEDRYLPAILEAWFPNVRGGKAIVETLFGENNPGGRLPVTFPRSVGQIEWNFPYKPWSHGWQAQSGNNGTGITSVDGALYPFGYGLSYTTFAYSNLRISPENPHTQSTVTVRCEVANTGTRTGDEVVQLYVRDRVSSVMTYDYQLRGFERVTLEPGERREVVFTLTPEDFELLDRNYCWRVEPGEFEIMIGGSSEDLPLKQIFEMSE